MTIHKALQTICI